MKSILKIIIHNLKLLQKNFERFTWKPNAHGTFWNVFFFFFVYLPSPNLGLTPPETYNPNARGSDACKGEQQSLGQNTRQIHKGEPPWMCGQHNVRASAKDNTQDRTQTKDTHSIPGQKLKFLNPPGWKVRTLPTTARWLIILKFTY